MPILPDITRGSRLIPSAPGGTVQARADVSEARAATRDIQAYGRSVSNTGAQLSEAMNRSLIEEQSRVDQLRAEDAWNELKAREQELTFGDDGYAKLQGKEAATRPVYKDYLERLDAAGKGIGEGLGNARQRELFQRRLEVTRLQMGENVLRHVARESEVYAAEVFEGTVKTEQSAAGQAWNEPATIALSIERIRQAVDERANRLGWPAEKRKQALEAALTGVHLSVIDSMRIEAPSAARDYFEANKSSIDGARHADLERAIVAGEQREIYDTFSAQYLTVEDDWKALESLRKEALRAPGLDENHRNALIGKIQNRQYTLERRAEVEQARRERHLVSAIGSFNDNTLAGFEPNAEQAVALATIAAGTPFEAEAKRAISLAAVTAEFRTADPLTQDKLIDQAELRVRDAPTSDARQTLSAWKSIRDQQRRQIDDNPLGFGVRQGIVKLDHALNLLEPTPEALAERFATARGVAERYQGKFAPLLAEDVRALSGALKDASVEDKRTLFARYAAAAGGDMRGYMGVMAQLAPDDPVSAVAGSLAVRGLQAPADLLLRGEAILRPDTDADGRPAGGALYPMPGDKEMRAEFDADTREAFAGNPAAGNAAFQAARAAYAALSVDAGDKDPSAFDSGRWETALQMALGGVDEYQGRHIVLPRGYDLDQFENHMNRRIEELVGPGSETAELERGLTEPERRIVAYHRENVATGTVGADAAGRAVTVLSTGIRVPEGPLKGRFVSVPGFVDGQVIEDEAALYQLWKLEIDRGMWPAYASGRELNQRSKEIHKLMEVEGEGGVLHPTWTPERLAELPLQNIGEGRYVFRSGDSQVLDTAGRPVVIDFNVDLPGRPERQPAPAAKRVRPAPDAGRARVPAQPLGPEALEEAPGA